MRLVWLSAVAVLLSLGGLAWCWAPLYPSVVALQLATTPRAFAAIVHLWPADDLALYRAALPLRFALLGGCAAFGLAWVPRSALFGGWAPALRRALSWVLPLAAAFGSAETALHLWLTEAPRFGVPAAYAVSAACGAVEWTLLASFSLAVALAAGRAAD